MIKLARVLGTQIIAEPVEKESDTRVLQKPGVEYGQGYLWGLPTPKHSGYSARTSRHDSAGGGRGRGEAPPSVSFPGIIWILVVNDRIMAVKCIYAHMYCK